MDSMIERFKERAVQVRDKLYAKLKRFCWKAEGNQKAEIDKEIEKRYTL